MMKSGITCCILVLIFSVFVFGQTQTSNPNQTTTNQTQAEQIVSPPASINRVENAVMSQVEAHRHKLGIFRFYGWASFNMGYDPNSVFGNPQAKEDEDFYFTSVPGASAGIKFGSRAFLHVVEQVQFLYYHKRAERRDIFNNTLVELLTGTPGMLLTLAGGYVKRDQPVDEEVDEPITHTTTHGAAGVEYSLTYRLSMTHNARISKIVYEPAEGSTVTLSNRRTMSFGTGSSYALTPVVHLNGNVNFNRSVSIETDVASRSWNVLGGASVEKRNLNFGGDLGYGRSNSSVGDSNRSNFLFDGHAQALLGNKLTITGFVDRKYQFSALSDSAVRVTTQGSIHASYPLNVRFSLDGTYIKGNNDYGDSLIGGEIIKKDKFQRASTGVSIRLFGELVVYPGLSYINHDTDIDELRKNRFGFFINLGLGSGFQF